jgi:hypothetical protein
MALYQAEQLQHAERLPQRTPAHSEPLNQGSFGWQSVAVSELPARYGAPYRIDDRLIFSLWSDNCRHFTLHWSDKYTYTPNGGFLQHRYVELMKIRNYPYFGEFFERNIFILTGEIGQAGYRFFGA